MHLLYSSNREITNNQFELSIPVCLNHGTGRARSGELGNHPLPS